MITKVRVYEMKLSQLLSILPFYQTKSAIDQITIKNLRVDSREVTDGDLFICIKGFTVDGHDYAEQAVKKGASAIIAEYPLDVDVPVVIVDHTDRALSLLATKFYDFPTDKMHLIGVTGTNGKTTTTYILEKIFQTYEKKTGVIGTIQMKIGDEQFPIINTTPDAYELQKSFQQMVKKDVDVAIMEVSSHALDLGRVHGSNFDCAIYTNLSQDHLDYHESMDNYLQAKTLLFSQLGNAYDEHEPKFAIVNVDDPYSKQIIKSSAQPIITYGIQENAMVCAKNIRLNTAHTSFDLHTFKGSVSIRSHLIGNFNVYNMLAAVCAALAYNIPLETIKSALESLTGISGRFEQINEGQKYTVIVDYAHTPDSLENVLQTVQEFAKGKIFVVVGSGGDRDRTKRPLMANVAIEYADHAFFTSDNPRTEDPEQILNDMVDHLTVEHFSVNVDRRQAIGQAIEQATSDDIIVIAGKGHETGQEINGKVYPFDDREVARQAILSKEQ